MMMFNVDSGSSGHQGKIVMSQFQIVGKAKKMAIVKVSIGLKSTMKLNMKLRKYQGDL